MRPDAASLAHAPKRFRTQPAKGLRASPAPAEIPAIDPEAGDRFSGVIRGAAICTRGEALGHYLWLDATFLQQVTDGINAQQQGVKCRFTHPSLSGDGLGTYLGRVKQATLDGDVVRADIHFAELARETPDGDLAGYVLKLAAEDPAAFGVSIVYSPDWGAEDLFEVEHQDKHGVFHSPDAENDRDLPHARIAELHAADVVDDPAANPDGLFHRGQELAVEADALLAYALKLSPQRPALAALSIDPDRAGQFLARFLANHHLKIVEDKPMPAQPAAPVAPATPENPALADAPKDPVKCKKCGADVPPDATKCPSCGAAIGDESQQSNPGGDVNALGEGGQPNLPTTVSNPAALPVEQLATHTPKEFLDAFGPAGAIWFCEGKSWDEAQKLHAELLQAENARLKSQLAGAQFGEATPVSPSQETTCEKPSPAARFAHLGPNVARFASGIQMPKQDPPPF